MTQQNTQPNLFDSLKYELSCEGVQITYLNRDKDGKSLLTYKDAEYDRSYTGDEILVQHSQLGSLVIVTLHYLPDVGSNILALLVPDALVADLSEPVKALAIKCFHSMPFAAPRPGTAQSYQVMLLEGSVRNPYRA